MPRPPHLRGNRHPREGSLIVNAAHKANKRERRVRSLQTRLAASQRERDALLKQPDINIHQKHTVDAQIKALRSQLANLL
jgi:hypothetical protein